MGGKYFFDRIPPDERVRLAQECGLTEEEEIVFGVRARKDSVIGTAMAVHRSDTTVKRRCRSIAIKLARCGHHGYMSECLEKKHCI